MSFDLGTPPQEELESTPCLASCHCDLTPAKWEMMDEEDGLVATPLAALTSM